MENNKQLELVKQIPFFDLVNDMKIYILQYLTIDDFINYIRNIKDAYFSNEMWFNLGRLCGVYMFSQKYRDHMNYRTNMLSRIDRESYLITNIDNYFSEQIDYESKDNRFNKDWCFEGVVYDWRTGNYSNPIINPLKNGIINRIYNEPYGNNLHETLFESYLNYSSESDNDDAIHDIINDKIDIFEENCNTPEELNYMNKDSQTFANIQSHHNDYDDDSKIYEECRIDLTNNIINAIENSRLAIVDNYRETLLNEGIVFVQFCDLKKDK